MEYFCKKWEGDLQFQRGNLLSLGIFSALPKLDSFPSHPQDARAAGFLQERGKKRPPLDLIAQGKRAARIPLHPSAPRELASPRQPELLKQTEHLGSSTGQTFCF